MRRLLIGVLVIGALLAAAAPAMAADSSLQRGQQEGGQARPPGRQALEAVKAGDRARAYGLARAAYLDHFEYVEIPLRLRNPNLVLDTEFKFAALRNDIRDGAPLGEIRRDTAAVREGLLAVDRELAAKGVAAPLIAFGFSFSILFREGIEAVLLIAILLGSLAAGSASNYKRPLAGGVAAAVLASVVTWVVATLILDLAPVSRGGLEGGTPPGAAPGRGAGGFWRSSRPGQPRPGGCMRAP